MLKKDASEPQPWYRYLLASAGLIVAFAAVHVTLGHLQFYHWNITTGLLFAALWLFPQRWWPALFVATIAARMVAGMVVARLAGGSEGFLMYWADPVQFVLGNVLQPFLVVTGVLMLHRWGVSAGAPASTGAIARLQLAAAVSALAVAGKDVLYVLNDGWVGDVRRGVVVDVMAIEGMGSWTLLTGFAIKNALGNFIGIMLVVPLVWWVAAPQERPGSRRILQAGIRYLLPAAFAYLLLTQAAPQSQMAELLHLLLMVAVVVFAMRHGWRGAMVSMFAVSLAIAIEDHLGQVADSPIQMQLFIAVTGAMGLLFGASMDGLRKQATQLQEASANATLLAEELYAAASRNLQAEERERRKLAADLHDEFGQNLTALQTHLKLATPDFAASGRRPVLDTMFQITQTMRRNINTALEALRPAALDELGLFAAIANGSMRRLAEDSGLEYEAQLEGDARLLTLLGDTQRIAAYRLVQEAVGNVVRHARATRCSVRLRASLRNGTLWLFLDVRDNGIGDPRYIKLGRGLTSMHDRVLALDGRMHLGNLAPGLRVHALLRQRLSD